MADQNLSVTSREGVSLTSGQSYTSIADQNLSMTSREGHSLTPDQSYTSMTDQNLSMTSREGLSLTPDERCTSMAGQDHPMTSRQGGLSLTPDQGCSLMGDNGQSTWLEDVPQQNHSMEIPSEHNQALVPLGQSKCTLSQSQYSLCLYQNLG